VTREANRDPPVADMQDPQHWLAQGVARFPESLAQREKRSSGESGKSANGTARNCQIKSEGETGRAECERSNPPVTLHCDLETTSSQCVAGKEWNNASCDNQDQEYDQIHGPVKTGAQQRHIRPHDSDMHRSVCNREGKDNKGYGKVTSLAGAQDRNADHHSENGKEGSVE
jgi:hypothetical protein